jgi:hypothetical protein
LDQGDLFASHFSASLAIRPFVPSQTCSFDPFGLTNQQLLLNLDACFIRKVLWRAKAALRENGKFVKIKKYKQDRQNIIAILTFWVPSHWGTGLLVSFLCQDGPLSEIRTLFLTRTVHGGILFSR